jgi:hypothetical protein
MSPEVSTDRGTTPWIILLVLLAALRVPSLAQPAGGDQSLYLYSGQRLAQGDVPYRDVFDQKPPGIMATYALLWRVWPHQSVVPAADLAATLLTAWLLVILGRRLCGPTAGFGGAAIFLLLGDPSIQRLGGLTIRAQCETFIALAVTASLVAVTSPRGRAWRFILGGVTLALAGWLKYNAIAYALPLVVAIAYWRPRSEFAGEPPTAGVANLVSFGAGAVGFSLLVLAYFAANGALTDLKLATIDYNLQYSRETYASSGPIAYFVTMPLTRARVDLLWFLGLLGAIPLVIRLRHNRAGVVVLAWLLAAFVSIVVNGARGLPQYFVQATPVLGLAAAMGLAMAWRSGRLGRAAVSIALLAGLWRVGTEPTTWWQPRLGGLPSVASNAAYDFRALTGRVDAREHLARFTRDEEGGKFPTVVVADLAAKVRASTRPEDPVLVFGFAGGGVLSQSGRVSATRFFWSRPVVVDFARDVPGYGPAGLLDELRRRPPAIVVLQKRDWRLREPDVPNSIEFFMAQPDLRAWLESGYVQDDDSAAFAVWRRKTGA